ncbi:MAG: hypothetical protein QOH24_2061 [Verrucomicrobiota bacterium]|jgi:hypothetical protein
MEDEGLLYAARKLTLLAASTRTALANHRRSPFRLSAKVTTALPFRCSARPGRYDFMNMKTRLITTLAGAALCCALSSTAFAGDPHSGGMTGQPSQSCQVTMVTPGRSATASGSAINPNGTAQAVYANPTSQGGISSGNTQVVAQYDVACFQQTARVTAGHGH